MKAPLKICVKSGDTCPKTGLWQATKNGRTLTVHPFIRGQAFPTSFGSDVVWSLL